MLQQGFTRVPIAICIRQSALQHTNTPNLHTSLSALFVIDGHFVIATALTPMYVARVFRRVLVNVVNLSLVSHPFRKREVDGSIPPGPIVLFCRFCD